MEVNSAFLQCIHTGVKCTKEDYDKGEESRQNYIKEMVNRFVDEDVKAPACLKTEDCAEDVVEAYKKQREEIFKEIHDEVKKVNRLK